MLPKRNGFAVILILLPLLFLSYLVLSIAVHAKDQKNNALLETISRSVDKTNLSSQASQTAQINSLLAKPTPSENPTPQSAIETKISFQLAPTPTPTPSPVSAPVQANNGNASSGGNYTVLTFDLGSTTVVTDNAADDDCDNNCATKSLAQYVSDNGGRAGMNGTFFCPPDYSWCSGKVNSSDFPIWNNRKKKWMNASKLFWNGRGMMVFRPGSAQFFPNSAAVGAPSDITGGIVNYPSLIAGGQTVFNIDSLSSGDKLRLKGTRNGIGYGNGKLFLLVASNADMFDLINIFKALGATDALNTDGGGSSALYQGGYRIGPGRLLPNAIIVK